VSCPQIYLVFCNGLWVLIPAILVWESAAHITLACSIAKTETSRPRDQTPGLPGVSWFYLIAATLVAYSIIVPGVLLVYADPPPAQQV
jgi:hypothetical protein